MSRRKASSLAALVLAVALIIVGTQAVAARSEGHTLYVRDQRGGEVFLEQANISPDTVIELSWIHSIEHEPWVERYHVEDTHLVLDEVLIKGYGAGVPAQIEGDVETKDGVVRMYNIGRRLDQLRWVHSHNTQHGITVGTTTLTTEIPHQSFVELVVH
ncbi:DUF1850 domain-containing protein [Corynebacterium sp. HMSC077B05]|uniref:DUF1850 domain-containing protein n=1 Tax=Corynebacterium sp. HMSC077B05 TaxID=1739252 RepID=UPI0009F4A8E6|nr:DUF1850 domain-containing protein [Corynebacterium sp. HMSC077B05]